MKRILFIFLFFYSIWVTYTQSGWQRLNINLSQSISDIQFIDQSTGYIAAGRNFAPGSIWKSTNGGNSWYLIFLTPGNMKSLYFNDANTGTIVGFKTNLRRTFDGGATWVTVDLSTVRSLNGVHFTSTSHGWVAGDSNSVYKTTDNGTSWIKSQSGSSDVKWGDVHFFDSNTGILVGESETRSRIVKTTDAGEHWTETTYPQGDWLRLSFSGDIGYAAGHGLQTGLIKTTDRGESWNFTGEMNTLKAVYCVNALVAYACGLDGQIYKTTNGGLSWIFQLTGVTSTLYGIYFINENTGWACGDNGVIIRTTNGGNPIGIHQISGEIPDKFALHQNYPNPFNPATIIRFDIPPLEWARGRVVRVAIYDLLGCEVAVLVNEKLAPGTYEVDFDASNLPSGTYFYRLQAGDFVQTEKMILLK